MLRRRTKSRSGILISLTKLNWLLANLFNFNVISKYFKCFSTITEVSGLNLQSKIVLHKCVNRKLWNKYMYKKTN
jgi:hypothetical protein